jgi:glycosyltransferase involved in cell wall biosynthesis
MSLIGSEFQNKVKLLPTSDSECSNFNLERTNVSRLKDYDKLLKLIWVGTFNNLRFLEEILPALDESARLLKIKTVKELQLKIISDAILETKYENLKIINIEWRREKVVEEMLTAHIGLMPLPNNNLAKGKCAFKAVQYIGFGIPVIASNVGFNKEVINDGKNGFLIDNHSDWINKVNSLATDINLWQKFSNNARTKWIKEFNTDDILAQIKNTIG